VLLFFHLLKFLFLTPFLLAINAPQAAEKRRTMQRTGQRTTPADAPTTDTSQTRRRQHQAEPPSLPIEDRNQPTPTGTTSGDHDIHLPAIPEASSVVSAINANGIQPGRWPRLSHHTTPHKYLVKQMLHRRPCLWTMVIHSQMHQLPLPMVIHPVHLQKNMLTFIFI